MPLELSGVNTYPAVVRAPADGDPANENTFRMGLSDLADRTAHLKERVETLGNPSGPADGSITRTMLAPGARPYDLTSYYAGKPPANAALLYHNAAREIALLKANPGNAKARSAATAATTLGLQRNGTAIGTITFAAGSRVGVVTLTADVVLAVNDEVVVLAPAAPDGTLSDVSVTLCGVY